jgi:hypothetical protein
MATLPYSAWGSSRLSLVALHGAIVVEHYAEDGGAVDLRVLNLRRELSGF